MSEIVTREVQIKNEKTNGFIFTFEIGFHVEPFEPVEYFSVLSMTYEDGEERSEASLLFYMEDHFQEEIQEYISRHADNIYKMAAIQAGEY